jgi:hypothetical protein
MKKSRLTAIIAKFMIASLIGLAVSGALAGELEDPPPVYCGNDIAPICEGGAPIEIGHGCSSGCQPIIEEGWDECCSYIQYRCPGTIAPTWRERVCKYIAKYCTTLGLPNTYDCRTTP